MSTFSIFLHYITRLFSQIPDLLLLLQLIPSTTHTLSLSPSSTHSPTKILSIIPRRIKNMIPMSPNALTLEQVRESQTRRDLLLAYDFMSIFRLANDEFANLAKD
jgi:hypothetical protein